MSHHQSSRDKLIINVADDKTGVTMVTSLDWGAATTVEKLVDLQHQLELYINDIIVRDVYPNWLVKQMAKSAGYGLLPDEFAREFLTWLVAHTWATIELAEPGQEPVDDIPMAKVAEVLIASLAGDTETECALLEQLSEVEILKGSMLLGVVTAMYKDELAAGRLGH